MVREDTHIKIEKELNKSRKSEALLANLLENSSQPFGVGYPDGRLGLVNKAFEELTGYTKDELKSTDWSEILTPHEFRDMENEKLEELQRTGQPVRYEKEYIQKDGSHVPIELLVHLVKNEDGTPEYYYSFITDITERKKAEEEIRYQAYLLTQVNDAVFGLDTNFRITYWNNGAEQMYGFTQAEARGNNSIELLRPKYAPGERESVIEELEHKGVSRTTISTKHKNGTDIIVEQNSTKISDCFGTAGYVVVYRNITKQKKVEEQKQKLLENEQQLTEELQTSNEELQSTTEELKVSNEELHQQQDYLVNLNQVLKESEEKFYKAFYANPAAMTLNDDKGGYMEVNESFMKLTGYSKQELIGHTPEELNIIKTKARQYAVNELKEKGSTRDIEYEIQTKSGENRIILSSFESIQIGTEIKFIAFIYDITDQKLAKAELTQYREQLEKLVEFRTAELEDAYESLKESKDHYLTLFNSIDEGFCTIEVIFDFNDKPIDYRFLEINPAFAKQTGLHDAQGKLMRDLAPDHEEHWFEIYGKIALTGKPLRFVNPANALHRWYDFYAFKIGGSESREVGIIFNDITKFKKTEEALKLSSRYNRSLIEASLDPLVTIGPDGKITDVNKSTESATGYSKDELIGTDFSDYFTEPEKARSGYKQVFKEGSVYDYPLEIKHKHGEITPVLYNASVYTDESSEVIGVFAAARDINEMKKAENKLKGYQDTLEEKVEKRTEELAKSNADLEHFAYVASHDLREPLRMITSFLQLLERRYNDKLDQDANEFIGFAVDGAKRLNDMINDLLEYSRVTNKEQVFRPVKLEKVLEEALINLIVPTEEHNAIIDYDPLPTVNGDEKLLVQLFQNLIGNAIKYHGQKPPKIHISSTKENNQYIISIKDNGIGIDSQHLDRIFIIFQRLHRNDEYEGTGIGLAIAQKIVHQHGGQIWAKSEPGKGTTLYFTIPN